jgi:hypothetical protein
MWCVQRTMHRPRSRGLAFALHEAIRGRCAKCSALEDLMHRSVFLIASLLCGAASLASAQQQGSSGLDRDRTGSVRLSTDIPLVAVLAPDRGGDPFVMFGLVGGYGLNGDYQITDYLSVGAGFFGGAAGNPAQNSSLVYAIAGLARAELSYPGSAYRAFLGVEVGGGGVGVTGAFSSPQGLFIVGMQGGVHIFVADGFSISPNVQFRWYRDIPAEVGLFQVAGGLSFTGWIG